MKSLQKLTVGEYQQLYTIHTSTDDEIDKAVLSVAILTGKTRWDVEEMPLDQFREISRSISILFSGESEPQKPKNYIKVNGKTYKICLNPRKLSAGQYIDLQHFLKGNMIDNLHKLMACLLVPRKFFGVGKYDGENHEQISAGIQNCNYAAIHATCVFFLTLWNLSIKAITPYLTSQILEKTTLNQTDLQNIMDGFLMHPPLLSTKG